MFFLNPEIDSSMNLSTLLDEPFASMGEIINSSTFQPSLIDLILAAQIFVFLLVHS